MMGECMMTPAKCCSRAAKWPVGPLQERTKSVTAMSRATDSRGYAWSSGNVARAPQYTPTLCPGCAAVVPSQDVLALIGLYSTAERFNGRMPLRYPSIW